MCDSRIEQNSLYRDGAERVNIMIKMKPDSVWTVRSKLDKSNVAVFYKPFVSPRLLVLAGIGEIQLLTIEAKWRFVPNRQILLVVE